MESLDQKFISLVRKNNLEGIKYWVDMTNKGHTQFTKEEDSETINNGYPTFHYSDVQYLTLLHATDNKNKDI